MLSLSKSGNSNRGRLRIFNTNKGVDLRGILQNDLGISGMNDFDTSFYGAGLVDTVMETKGKVQRTVGRATGMAGADQSGTVQAQTKLSWTGSQKPLFSVQVAFVCLKDNDIRHNVVNQSMQAMKCVYPTMKLGQYVAPLDYNPQNIKDSGLNLAIGNWFLATNLVMKSANFTYSKVTLRSGRPLFAIGEIVLEPYQSISYDEFRAYFKV